MKTGGNHPVSAADIPVATVRNTSRWVAGVVEAGEPGL